MFERVDDHPKWGRFAFAGWVEAGNRPEPVPNSNLHGLTFQFDDPRIFTGVVTSA